MASRRLEPPTRSISHRRPMARMSGGQLAHGRPHPLLHARPSSTLGQTLCRPRREIQHPPRFRSHVRHPGRCPHRQIRNRQSSMSHGSALATEPGNRTLAPRSRHEVSQDERRSNVTASPIGINLPQVLSGAADEYPAATAGLVSTPGVEAPDCWTGDVFGCVCGFVVVQGPC
jgi:hypothetical protein